MSVPPLLVSCLALCMASVPAVGSAHRAGEPCKRAQEVVFARHGSVVLLSHHRARPASDLLVACWVRSHKRTVVGPLEKEKLLPRFFSPGVYQLAGRYFVAPRFRYFRDDPAPTASRLVRVDVRSGEIRYLTSGDDRATRATIATFFAKPNGSVAWMREALGVDYVELRDQMGRRTVDSGPDSSIVYGSLELAPDQMTITWIRDGAQMSAPFI